jgi:dTMP kinase
MAAPFFLSLDGLDGTGKTTQGHLLAERLRASGHVVTTCADPGGTALGLQLRTLLLSHRSDMALPCEALLFLASRAQLVVEVIRPALTAGGIVLVDRFTLATVVYQGYAGGLDPQTLWQVGAFATGGLEPDLTLILDLSLDEAVLRRGRPPDRVEGRSAEYHSRVRQGYLTEARRHPERIRIIDASASVEEVHEALWREVSTRVGSGE